MGQPKEYPICRVPSSRGQETRYRHLLPGRNGVHRLRSCRTLFAERYCLVSDYKAKNADWVNLANLWLLRNCIRENYNHGIGIEDMIFGKDVDTLQPMTKQRLFAAAKEIQRRDKYVTL